MDIRKAILLASQATGGIPLIPEDLDPVLVEYLYRVAPILRRIDKKEADGKTHELNRRIGVPSAWFSDETTVVTAAHSTYERMSVQIKILRTPKGGVSGFQRAASKRYIDSLEAELLGMVEAIADLYEWSMLWSCSNDVTPAPAFTGDVMQYTGLLPYIFHDAYAAANNVIDAGSAACTLTNLDDLLNAVEAFRGVQRDPKVFLASRQMISRIGGLETHIYRIPETVEFVAGWSVTAYKHVPIVPSDFLSPAATTTSPSLAVGVSEINVGTGALVAGDYFYRISTISRTGEQLAGAAGTVNIAAGPSDIQLDWAADASADAFLYFIWRGTTDATCDNLQLIDVIAAKTYTAGEWTGEVIQYIDAGARSEIATIHPLASGEQNIVLMNLHPQRGSGLLYLPSELWEDTSVPPELAAEAGNIKPLFGLIELARTRSAWDFQLEGYTAMKVPWPRLHGVIRRVKYA